jgi:hypothetical protein
MQLEATSKLDLPLVAPQANDDVFDIEQISRQHLALKTFNEELHSNSDTSPCQNSAYGPDGAMLKKPIKDD